MTRKLPTLAGLLAAGSVFAAGPAAAYIGPGAGLSLLGALWGVLAAIVAALLFLLFWPLRRLLRRRANASAATARPAAERPQPGDSPQRR